MDFEIESNVDTAKFEEAAAEGTSGEPRWGVFGKVFPATDQNIPGPAGDYRDFVNAVLSADLELFHVLKSFQLHAVRPRVRRPGVEESAR